MAPKGFVKLKDAESRYLRVISSCKTKVDQHRDSVEARKASAMYVNESSSTKSPSRSYRSLI